MLHSVWDYDDSSTVGVPCGDLPETEYQTKRLKSNSSQLDWKVIKSVVQKNRNQNQIKFVHTKMTNFGGSVCLLSKQVLI